MKKSLSFLSVIALLASASPALAASSAVSIGSVMPVSATVNTPTMLSASVSSNAGSITTCNLYIDNDDKGVMTVSGGTASKSYVFPSAQVYTVFVFCHDSASNMNSGPNTAVWAQGGGGGYGSDITPPIMGSLSPSTATVNAPVNFTLSVSDTGGISGCTLYVGGQSAGAMTVSGGVATKSHTFTSSGPASAYAQCTDTSSNTGTSATIAVSVSPAQQTPPQASGSLVKLVCPVGALADHPCKAVYYQGLDGKRHSFPNERVFFSWYADFSSVKEISSAALAALPLGKNVTYRPGSRMLKFPSVAQVYAVAKGGVLRWVKTEADAKALYGDTWNKKVDDMSEAFFMDYKYGTDISPSAPFDVAAEMNGAQTIDQTM